jgi:hypothetical protein
VALVEDAPAFDACRGNGSAYVTAEESARSRERMKSLPVSAITDAEKSRERLNDGLAQGSSSAPRQRATGNSSWQIRAKDRSDLTGAKVPVHPRRLPVHVEAQHPSADQIQTHR